LEAVTAADQAYAIAWLTNDPEQVMATLVEDAVLLPSGLPAVEGDEAIREFWWPADSPPTTVVEFTVEQREVGGSEGFGFVRGSFSLGFEYDGETYASGGNYLSLLQRGSDARWRISHRMWSDSP
jgi:ketosteroid isomerase-like protein